MLTIVHRSTSLLLFRFFSADFMLEMELVDFSLCVVLCEHIYTHFTKSVVEKL